jgi:hypothetical protein
VLLAVPITSVLQSTIQCVYARIKGQVI